MDSWGLSCRPGTPCRVAAPSPHARSSAVAPGWERCRSRRCEASGGPSSLRSPATDSVLKNGSWHLCPASLAQNQPSPASAHPRPAPWVPAAGSSPRRIRGSGRGTLHPSVPSPGAGCCHGASRTRLQIRLRSRQREPPPRLGAVIYRRLIDTSSATLTPFPAAALMTYF